MQEGDVLLEQTNDDGEITVVNGITEMTGSFETAAYLSLFGGNVEDTGSGDNTFTWWGNIDELDPAFQYRSETQYLLDILPATSNNLVRLQDAALRDLNWFTEKNIASSVVVSVSIPGVDKIKIVADIEAFGNISRFEFIENWKAST